MGRRKIFLAQMYAVGIYHHRNIYPVIYHDSDVVFTRDRHRRGRRLKELPRRRLFIAYLNKGRTAGDEATDLFGNWQARYGGVGDRIDRWDIEGHVVGAS